MIPVVEIDLFSNARGQRAHRAAALLAGVFADRHAIDIVSSASANFTDALDCAGRAGIPVSVGMNMAIRRFWKHSLNDDVVL